ncbi:MAG TPA: choice-of-anchor tandem repeat GloVer-containing protein, partial [Verrucomicrobiae bacterium]|nr:choice-of-anchor tandem repeat GloVer-containing protein [Verrucomicrobiae bacterium]
IFSISTNGPVFAVLHDFSPLDLNSGTNSDGATPAGGLVLAGDTLYGTASAGGAGGAGIVFSIRTNGGNFTVLYPFSSLDAATATNVDGACPVGGLVLSNGLLYGTTLAGGPGGSGVIFAVGTNGLGFSVLHSFSAVDLATGTNEDGASPCGTLALANGRLYGPASAGGANGSGAVFSIDTNGAEFQLIYAFSALATAAGTNRDGAFPVASVLPVGNSLYGAAFAGGPGGEGTLFSLSLPPASARITDVRRNIDGTIRLSFAGGADSTNVVQAATNLTSASWQNLSTNTADTNGLWEFVDTTATQYPGRYYRSLSF